MKIIISLKNHARKVRDFIFDLIFPVQCLNCGQEGAWLCAKCSSQLKVNAEQFCLYCKKGSEYGKFCPSCLRRHRPSLNGIIIAGNYRDKITAKLIQNLKYYFVRDISFILGNYLSLCLQNVLNQSRLTSLHVRKKQLQGEFKLNFDTPKIFANFNQTLIIPVPLHKRRMRWRGFNQANDLALMISKNFRLKINNRDLIASKHKKPQVKLSGSERKKNVRNCFAWQGKNLTGQNIFLIDDVATTGSTLNECAKTLKTHGAGEIWGLVVASG